MTPIPRTLSLVVSAACALASPLALALGSTPVTVVNAADIAKAQGIQQPFQAGINCNAAGGFGIRCSGSISVPAGQRWVIEQVSANCRIDNTRQQLSQVYLSPTLSGGSILHYLAIPDHVGAVGDSGSVINVVQLSQRVRFYVDAGGSVGIGAGMSAATSFTGYPNCDFSLSGQAVSVP